MGSGDATEQVMSETELERRVVGRLRALLLALPFDLKLLFELASDAEVSADARGAAMGGIIYCLTPNDLLPEVTGGLAHVDDAIALRLVLAQVQAVAPASATGHLERFTEQFAVLSDDLELLRTYFGDGLTGMLRRIERLQRVKYKGCSIARYVDDAEATERLYREVLEFATEYDVDDAAVAKLTSVQRVRAALQARYAADAGRR